AAEAMYQSQPVGQIQQRPALQPTPSYPSIPSPAGAQFNAPNNPSPAPQNVPNSTHHLDQDQDGSYGYEEEPLPFDQYNESRGGQSCRKNQPLDKRGTRRENPPHPGAAALTATVPYS